MRRAAVVGLRDRFALRLARRLTRREEGGTVLADTKIKPVVVFSPLLSLGGRDAIGLSGLIQAEDELDVRM